MIKLIYKVVITIGIIAISFKGSVIQNKRGGPVALLILIFIKSSFIFLLLDFIFLGLSYIIVYVGALSILFLFIIKMAGSHDESGSPQTLVPTILVPMVLILVYLEEGKEEAVWNYFIIEPSSIFISFTDIESFGILLYIANPFITLLFGILLWCVLIGVIIISV